MGILELIKKKNEIPSYEKSRSPDLLREWTESLLSSQEKTLINCHSTIMDISTLIKKTNEIPSYEKSCTQSVLREWKDSPPLFQEKILINCHLTTATLLLVELFLFSGAEIKITCTSGLVCHESIKELLFNLGIYLPPTEISSLGSDYFDAVIDCGAYLANSLQPQKAFIELTHVEASQYKNINCSVVSVDNSFIKHLETTYGTGDGFVRAIDQLYTQNGHHYQNKTYMVFGYGKVGKGICSCLHSTGVNKRNIIIVEINEEHIIAAQAQGFSAYSLHQDKEKIIKLLENSIHCAVTATGVENSISLFFEPSAFANVEYLANMGTYDEWGEAFSEDVILNHKSPLNFILDYPTKIMYLDPIFALLACATLDTIKQRPQETSLLAQPKLETQKKILDIWTKNNKHPDVEQLWQQEVIIE